MSHSISVGSHRAETHAGGVSGWSEHLRRTRWAYRSPTLQGLSLRFAVRCTDPSLGMYIDPMLEPLRSPVPAAHWYSLVSAPGGEVDVLCDDDLVARAADRDNALAWLSWDVNRLVTRESTEHLLLHAGGVEGRAGGLLLPGPPGCGKTTLVAGLVHAGLDYLSDEVMGLRTSDATLLPYPRALSVKQGSFAALRHLGPIGIPSAEARAQQGGEHWYLSHSDIRTGALGRPCEAGFVVMPRYQAHARTSLRALSSEEAFLGLVTNTLNFEQHGANALELLRDIVEGCDCYELVVSDLEPACEIVLGLMED